MPLFWQRPPESWNPFKLPKRDRSGLARVGFDVDPEDLELLDRLVKETGLKNRTRLLRWLLWVWKALEDRAYGTEQETPWKWDDGDLSQGRVYLAIVQMTGEYSPNGNEKMRVRRVAAWPNGWRKG